MVWQANLSMGLLHQNHNFRACRQGRTTAVQLHTDGRWPPPYATCLSVNQQMYHMVRVLYQDSGCVTFFNEVLQNESSLYNNSKILSMIS